MTARRGTAEGGYQLLTGAGPAAVAVVRVYGPRAALFVARHLQRRSGLAVEGLRRGAVLRATLTDVDGAPLDDILVSSHGDEGRPDLRLHLHGNPALVRCCRELLQACGLAAAEPAAAPWPMRDGLEADVIELLPAVLTWRGTKWLMGQAASLRRELQALLTDRDLHASPARCAALAAGVQRLQWFVHPLRVVLLGPPNAGKSTLINALADRPVSIVTAEPGTTRDWVEAPSEVQGFPVVWIDTAGLRETADPLEALGMERTQALARTADVVVLVVDVSQPDQIGGEWVRRLRMDGRTLTVVLNKCDQAPPSVSTPMRTEFAGEDSLCISALRRSGLDVLVARVLALAGRTDAALAPVGAYHARQAELLRAAAGVSDHKHVRRMLLGLMREAGGAGCVNAPSQDSI